MGNISSYNIEAIKSIYKDDTPDNSNNDYIEENYLNNHIYFNAFQVPDKIVGLNGVHTFSRNRSNGEIGSHSSINSSIMNKHMPYAYNQILLSKDIDWDNAYLRYMDTSSIKSNQPFTYHLLNDEGKTIQENVKEEYEQWTEDEGEKQFPSQYIKSTNDLMNVLDYLFDRYNRLHTLMNIVTTQNEIINSKTQQNI